MSSTFGSIQSSLTGLMAARKQLDVTGQNVANSTVDGYTRQSAQLQAKAPTGQVSLQGVADNVGNGVQVTTVSRASDALLNAGVHSTAAASALAAGRSATLTSLENLTAEPTNTGLGGQLDTMWNAWGDLSNAASTVAASASASTAANIRPVVLQDTQQVVAAIKSGYQSVSDQWDDQYKQAQANVASANSTASSVAALNAKIKMTVASGGDANTLMDQRDTLVTSLSTLTGATAQANDDGTVDVYLGGHALVAQDKAYSLTTDPQPAPTPAPTKTMSDGFTLDATTPPGTMTYTRPATVYWADASGPVAASVTSGKLGANLDAMNSTLPSAASNYDKVASALATSVNTAIMGTAALAQSALTNPNQQSLTSKDGTDAGAYALFGTTNNSAVVTASTLMINAHVSSDPTGQRLAVGATGYGTADASIADRISQLGTAATGPNAAWKSYVADLGTQSAAATLKASLTATAASTAVANQQAVSGVSMDEETTNLITAQRTYQGAAKVMSAVDQMLQTLLGMVN